MKRISLIVLWVVTLQGMECPDEIPTPLAQPHVLGVQGAEPVCEPAPALIIPHSSRRSRSASPRSGISQTRRSPATPDSVPEIHDSEPVRSSHEMQHPEGTTFDPESLVGEAPLAPPHRVMDLATLQSMAQIASTLQQVLSGFLGSGATSSTVPTVPVAPSTSATPPVGSPNPCPPSINESMRDAFATILGTYFQEHPLTPASTGTAGSSASASVSRALATLATGVCMQAPACLLGLATLAGIIISIIVSAQK